MLEHALRLCGKVIEKKDQLMGTFTSGIGVEILIRVRDLVPVKPKFALNTKNHLLAVAGSAGNRSVGSFDHVVVKVMDDVEERIGERNIKMMLVSVNGPELERMKRLY
ncbi:unnamed protein product [Tuber aestivum]|uniref:Exosome complex exonuclease RRP44 S1 domain-containing protein n=1 Tax=Tuber aestivum TaxID=59557 RepID=A0A292PY07_9PEZI|nr:unnamed protein product [Tuber aestivum]